MRNIVLLALVVAGCNGASSTGISEVTCPTESTLTYENFGAAFMETNCGSCHEGKESPNLSTQASVLSHRGQILDEAVYTDAMPEDEDLALEERRMLGEWLACGAP